MTISTHGFKLIKEEKLSEVNGIVKLFKHEKTGAELLSVCNDDVNKCFGVNFRTPPKNSTGVAHILEHSVLCGSQKYPTKEPFVELLKSSLQTFLNAMTYPDKTCYPVASTNTQDLYNLMDVYMDAVFFPRVRTSEGKDILAQEGWHIDTSEGKSLEDTDKWQFKGVVYNEMKGVYSSPDSLLAEQSQQAVFPDNLYSLDSGGAPEHIIELSFEEFEEFHKLYYHPSNARFFFWGDDDEEIRLKKVNDVISSFEKIELNSSIPLQERLSTARKIEVPFEVADSDDDDQSNDEAQKGHATVNWLLCESYDVEKNLLFCMLDHILTELPGSALRKTLIDSGLGEDITGHLEGDLRQMYFSIGLRSLELGKEDEMEALVLDTLAELVENKVPAKAIEAAVNATEFTLREANTGRYPKGLVAMTQSLTHWLYDEDPFTALAWEAPLAKIKERLANKEEVFEKLIKEYFLDNTHRVLVSLVPDKKLAQKRQEEEKARVETILSSMSKEQKIFTDNESKRLLEVQAKEDSEEALASIPMLTLEDLPTKNRCIPLEKKQEIMPLYLHNIETTGIIYSRFVFGLESVDYSLLPYLSLYSRALTEIGTKNYNFIDLGLEIEATTGGIGAYPSIQARIDSKKVLASFVLAGKATKDKLTHLTSLFEEIIFHTDFDNQERFSQMVFEEKARLEQAIIPSGHSYVLSQLSARHSKVGAINEYTQGVSYLEFIRTLAKNTVENWPQVLSALKEIHASIFKKSNALLDLTANASLLEQAKKSFTPLLERIENKEEANSNKEWEVKFLQGNEALIVPAMVNYVGMSTNLHEAGYKFHGSALVISRFLRMGYLWDRIRVQGGAYGCFVRYSRVSGSFSFVSYRDPQVEKSLEVYSKAPDFLGNLHLSQRDLTCAIIGTIGDIDTYLLPSAQGLTSLWRDLTADTEELRQQIREEVMSTKLEDFQNFAAPLQKALDKAQCVALGGKAVEDYAKTHNWNIKKII